MKTNTLFFVNSAKKMVIMTGIIIRGFSIIIPDLLIWKGIIRGQQL